MCRVVFAFAYGKRRDHGGLEPRREKRENKRDLPTTQANNESKRENELG
jgi:hypothetical protein